MAKWVYEFGDGKAEGRADMRNLLGGKGAGLAEMSNLGLPVPPGFTITTEVCTFFYQNDKKYPADLRAQVEIALQTLEKRIGAAFGDAKNPLLVSVRSGARASMPGMEARAPERTDTSRGASASPKRLAVSVSTRARAAATSPLRPSG